MRRYRKFTFLMMISTKIYIWKHDMAKYIFFMILLGIALLHSEVHCFTVNEAPDSLRPLKEMTKMSNQPQSGNTVKPRGKVHSSIDLRVTNIIIDKIDHNYIYSKDGRSFAISDSTRIINNHDPEVKLQTGELFFQNGKLVAIVIR